MASWKTIVFLKTKPRKKSFRESFTFRAPTEQPRLFYDMVDPDLKKQNAYTEQQNLARCTVRLNEDNK